MPRLEIVPLPSDHHVAAGDDLAALVLDAAAEAGFELTDGDVVCVASKVVSKAEDAVVDLPPGDVHEARRQLAESQAVRVVADTPWVLVVETTHGFVCANAGIDTSNVDGDGRALLLPHDPDTTAAALRDSLRDRTGVEVGVVITDTFGRPWRLGQTDVALGAAGITALRDERGSVDMNGQELEVTLVAVADELAAAADLARRKADGTPFVVIRGADVTGEGTARDLVRPADEDTFRYGGRTAITRVLEERPLARTFADREVDQDAIRAAALTAATAFEPVASPGWELLQIGRRDRKSFAAAGRTMEGAEALASAPVVLVFVGGSGLAVGAAIQSFQVALGAFDLASDFIELDPEAARAALATESATTWGALVVGHPLDAPDRPYRPSTAPVRPPTAKDSLLKRLRLVGRD